MCCLMRFVGLRCNPWHRNRCKNHLEFHSNRLSTYRLAKEEIESYLDIKMPAGWSTMNVDALNAKGKGEGKAGVEGWYRDPKGNGKPSCAHCGRRLIGQHTEWDCWCNCKNPSPEARAKRLSKAKRKRCSLAATTTAATTAATPNKGQERQLQAS